MSREMIVGREYIVGGQHDYDELLDHAMGAEPAPPPAPQTQHPPPPVPPHVPPAPYPYLPYPPPSGWPAPHPRAISPAYDRDPRGPRLVPDHPRHARQFPIGLTK